MKLDIRVVCEHNIFTLTTADMYRKPSPAELLGLRHHTRFPRNSNRRRIIINKSVRTCTRGRLSQSGMQMGIYYYITVTRGDVVRTRAYLYTIGAAIIYPRYFIRAYRKHTLLSRTRTSVGLFTYIIIAIVADHSRRASARSPRRDACARAIFPLRRKQ